MGEGLVVIWSLFGLLGPVQEDVTLHNVQMVTYGVEGKRLLFFFLFVSAAFGMFHVPESSPDPGALISWGHTHTHTQSPTWGPGRK